MSERQCIRVRRLAAVEISATCREECSMIVEKDMQLGGEEAPAWGTHTSSRGAAAVSPATSGCG